MSISAEKLLTQHVENAHNEVNPGQALDPTAIIAIVTAILDAIRGCRNEAKARDHIKRGSIVAVAGARRAIADAGYNKPLALARDIVHRGESLADSEVDAIFTDVNDLPTPPALTGGGWPVWTAVIALVCCLVLPVAAEASWPVVAETSAEASETSWPVSIPATVEQDVAMPAVEPSPEVRESWVIPSAQPWTYSGDNGTRESMIGHLMSGNHRETVMRWMGITDPAEYEQELARLTYSELHQLHSADHEHLTKPGGATTAPTSTASVDASAGVATAGGGRWETQRAGIFGLRTKRVWVPANKARSVRMFSGGCPGGACPLR